jgi:hypothetical protein
MAALCGFAYYCRSDLPMMFSSVSQRTERTLPDGLIIQPHDNSTLCQLHVIDSATGQIRDKGLADCLDAVGHNAAAWRTLTNAQKAAEIRKSFRGQ